MPVVDLRGCVRVSDGIDDSIKCMRLDCEGANAQLLHRLLVRIGRADLGGTFLL